jgi:hypothetical protein
LLINARLLDDNFELDPDRMPSSSLLPETCIRR